MLLKFLNIFAILFIYSEFPPCTKKILQRNDIIVCMTELNPRHGGGEVLATHTHTHTHTQAPPVLQKIKDGYLLWHGYCQNLPKSHKHSFGFRIDSLFVELIEAVSAAGFLSPEEKRPYVRLAMKKTDAIKVLVMILWEAKSLDEKKYIALSVKLDEIGRNLGGWNGQLTKQTTPKTVPTIKQNSPELTKKTGEK